ncbi:DNA helicase [Ophidiomyces ophidiicola]|nr:DNA helicase [Ophidiomyces ophidiicola]
MTRMFPAMKHGRRRIIKEQPLEGVILCFTSILPEERTQLVAISAEMGATHKFDLTSDVTHLIVGETSTPKYKYVARERSDIKVVTADWVAAVRSSWLLGGDTDLHTLEEEYRVPTFAGLSICITGFEDLDFRNHLQKTITSNGGKFCRDLTKTATHLIARAVEGQKYKFAVLWGIKAVSLKWLEDSLSRGMILEETLYDPLLPAEKHGIGAWNSAPSLQVQKRSKLAENGSRRPRKLRRVASVKLTDQNEGIWTDIVGNMTSGASENEFLDDQHGSTSHLSFRSIIQEEKSFASETTLSGRRDGTRDTVVKIVPVPQKSRGIWYNSKFFISGFTAKQVSILENHLISRDAVLVRSRNELSDKDEREYRYILIPYNTPPSEIPSTTSSNDDVQIVTDMWVEKCLHSNAFLPPEAHTTSTPIPRFPILAFENLTICSTGFTGIDLLHLCKLVRLLGAVYDEYFTSKASVLICNTPHPNKDKLRHASQWNVPAVLSDWLWISVQTGDKKPFKPYLLPDWRPSSSKSQTAGNQTTHNESDELRAQDPSADQADNQDSYQPRITPSNDTPEVTDLPGKTKTPSPTIAAPKISDKQAKSATANPLDVAISELLKQKRNRVKPTTDQEKSTTLPPRRRRLFGRANSNSSALSVKEPGQVKMSRASSIDTLNEDGYGSVVDLLSSPSGKGQSREAQSFVSEDNLDEAEQKLKDRLSLFRKGHTHEFVAEKFQFQDAETPPMTQLGYEDPDALAMREKFTRKAQEMNAVEESGQDTKKGHNKRRSGGNLIIGTLQDSNTIPGGRRTRSKAHDFL